MFIRVPNLSGTTKRNALRNMAGYFLPRAVVRYSRLANISRLKAAGNSYKKLVSTRKASFQHIPLKRL